MANFEVLNQSTMQRVESLVNEKKQINARARVVASGPIQLSAGVQNLVKLPFQLLAMVTLKPLMYAMSKVTHSVKVQTVKDSLPGAKDVFRVAVKVVSYITIGGMNLLVGAFISPKASLAIQRKAHLIQLQKPNDSKGRLLLTGPQNNKEPVDNTDCNRPTITHTDTDVQNGDKASTEDGKPNETNNNKTVLNENDTSKDGNSDVKQDETKKAENTDKKEEHVSSGRQALNEVLANNEVSSNESKSREAIRYALDFAKKETTKSVSEKLCKGLLSTISNEAKSSEAVRYTLDFAEKESLKSVSKKLYQGLLSTIWPKPKEASNEQDTEKTKAQVGEETKDKDNAEQSSSLTATIGTIIQCARTIAGNCPGTPKKVYDYCLGALWPTVNKEKQQDNETHNVQNVEKENEESDDTLKTSASTPTTVGNMMQYVRTLAEQSPLETTKKVYNYFLEMFSQQDNQTQNSEIQIQEKATDEQLANNESSSGDLKKNSSIDAMQKDSVEPKETTLEDKDVVDVTKDINEFNAAQSHIKALYWTQRFFSTIFNFSGVIGQNDSSTSTNEVLLSTDKEKVKKVSSTSLLSLSSLTDIENPEEKVKEYELEVEKGNSSACFELGEYYQSKDIQKAYEYYKKAADLGDVRSMMRFAQAFEAGYPFEQDTDEAQRWYEKAAAAGDINASYICGMHSYNESVRLKADNKPGQADRNARFAFTRLLKAAENGHGNAMYYLAGMYQTSMGTEGNPDEALKWLSKVAILGERYLPESLRTNNEKYKPEPPKDEDAETQETAQPSKETESLSEVTPAFCANAFYQLAVLNSDKADRKNLYEKAAALGHTKASLNLGHIYLRDKEKAKALEAFKQAASDYPQAAYKAGVLLENGDAGISEDKQAAFNFYKKALKVKHGQAAARLAYLCSHNFDEVIGATYTQVDKEKAVYKYLQKASIYGDVPSMYQFAELCLKGIEHNDKEIIASDQEKALLWFEKAAEKGNVEAQIKLADIYQNGSLGQTCDDEKAKDWLRQAADKGSSTAKGLLDNYVSLSASKGSDSDVDDSDSEDESDSATTTPTESIYDTISNTATSWWNKAASYLRK